MSSTILSNIEEVNQKNKSNSSQQNFSLMKLFTRTSVKNKFQIAIHICMIFLCIVATFLIINENRLLIKIVLGLFMALYLFFVAKNKIFQKIILEEVYQQQYENKYKKTQTLDFPDNFFNKQENDSQIKDKYKLKQNKNYRQYLLQLGQQRGSSSLTNANPMQKSMTKSNLNMTQKQSFDESAPLQVVRSMSRSVIGSIKNVVDQVKNSVFKGKQDSSSPNNEKQNKKLTSSFLIEKDKSSSSQKRGFNLVEGLRNNAWKKKQPMESSSTSSQKFKCLSRNFLAVDAYDQNQGKQYNKRFVASLQSQNLIKNYPNIWQKFKKGLLKQLNQILQKHSQNWKNLIINVQKYYNVKIIKQSQKNRTINFEQGSFNFRQSQIFNDILSFQRFNFLVKQKKIKMKNTNQKLLAEQYLTKLFQQREQIDTLLNIYNCNYQIRQKKIKLIKQIPVLIDQRIQPMVQSAETQTLHAEAKVLCLIMFVNKINVISDVYNIKMMGILTNKKAANIQIICQKGSDNIIPHYNLKFKNNLIHCQYGVNNPLNVLALMFCKIWQQIYKNGEYKGSFNKKQDLIAFLKNFCINLQL